MAVRKRGDTWYYDFMIKGVRYRAAVPEAQNKQQAQTAESQARLAVFNGEYGKPAGDTSFIEYAEKVFLPWSKENKRSTNDQYHIKTFKAYFGDKNFREITPMLIEKFKRDRLSGKTRYDRERRPASVNRELQCLSKIFNMAIRDRVASTNPCRGVKLLGENNERTRYLTVKEEQDLFAQLTGPRAHIRPIVILAIHTGMRRGEILSLKWGQVDFSRNLIHVTRTKTGRDRFVPINETVREELLRLSKESKGEAVFTNSRTGKALGWIKRGFSAACKEAGLVNFTFHDLRHSCATRLADSGADAFTIAEILGHRDLRQTKRYTHATDARKREALGRLANYGQSEKNCLRIVSKRKRKAG